MENIEKRIEAFINTMPNVSVNFRDGSKYGYHNGAVEQLEIDIEKACSVLRDILVFEFVLKEDNPIDKNCIEEDIEKLRNAMKGGNE